MKILLVNNQRIKSTVGMAAQIAGKLEAHNITVEIDDSRSEKIVSGISSIMVLGGDGTFIRTARKYLTSEVPVLGINMGTVGFLSNIEAEQVDNYLDRFIRQDYTVDERMMLEIIVHKDGNLIESYYALNELTVKSSASRLVKLKLEIGENAQFNYRGDGVIISTPTGSTAYALSCGGPIADPDLEAFIVTPLAAYSFNKKPMVIAPDKLISLYPWIGNDLSIFVDGQDKGQLDQNHYIEIKKAAAKLKMINLKGESFFQTIDSKLQRREV